MNFAQTLCLGLFLAILGGLGTLAVGRPDAYIKLFPYMYGVLCVGGIGVALYDGAFTQGVVAQWRATPTDHKGDFVASPIPKWFNTLGLVMYVALFLLWIAAQILRPDPVSTADAHGQAQRGQQAAQQGAAR